MVVNLPSQIKSPTQLKVQRPRKLQNSVAKRTQVFRATTSGTRTSTSDYNNLIQNGSAISQQVQEEVLSGRDVESQAVARQIEIHKKYPQGLPIYREFNEHILEDAYKQCGDLTKEYGRTFYFGTLFMTKEKAKRVWAIYQWCRRTDEIVDGPNANVMLTNEMGKKLDDWEVRLENLFEGKPFDPFDAALTDTLSHCPLDIQPFKDMIQGMRMDLYKKRYQTFEELYGYCYRVAGTVGLMSAPIMGMDPSVKDDFEPVYRSALALGHANQLTNIIRDVGADKEELNRVYMPLQELEQFGLKESDLDKTNYRQRSKKTDESWKAFMKFQIGRAKGFFLESEQGVYKLNKDARWPVLTALDLYSRILDKVEENDYDNITKRAFVPTGEKVSRLPYNLIKSWIPAPLIQQFQKLQIEPTTTKKLLL